MCCRERPPNWVTPQSAATKPHRTRSRQTGSGSKRWWAWVDLNHRPRPYQGNPVRFYNNLQESQEPRGLPKYLQVAHDIANCGSDCGLEIPLSEGDPQ